MLANCHDKPWKKIVCTIRGGRTTMPTMGIIWRETRKKSFSCTNKMSNSIWHRCIHKRTKSTAIEFPSSSACLLLLSKVLPSFAFFLSNLCCAVSVSVDPASTRLVFLLCHFWAAIAPFQNENAQLYTCWKIEKENINFIYISVYYVLLVFVCHKYILRYCSRPQYGTTIDGFTNSFTQMREHWAHTPFIRGLNAERETS